MPQPNFQLAEPIAVAHDGQVFTDQLGGDELYTHVDRVRILSAAEARYAAIKRDLDALEARGIRALRAVMVEMRDFLVGKVRTSDASKIVRTLDFSGRVRADLRRAIRQFMGRAWDAGSRDARREVREGKAEVRSHDADPFTPQAALKWLDDKSFWISGVTGDHALAAAKAVLLQGLKTGKSNKEMIDGISQAFEPWVGKAPGVEAEVVDPWRLETIVRTNGTDAYNHGRLTEFLSPDLVGGLVGIRYSAILDERTTEVCRFLDGKVFHPGDADLEELVPPNHFNCRSIVVPVVSGEKVDEAEFITDEEVGHAKALADQKFLAARGAWRAYSERED